MIELNNEQKMEKENMMKQMEKDIKTLEQERDNIVITNIKIKILRDFKIFLCTGRLIAPYLITVGIMFGIFSGLGATPFVKDVTKKKLEIKKEIDSLGNVFIEKQYDSYRDAKATVTYYGKWAEDNDVWYSRVIKTYSIDKLDEDFVLDVLDNQNTIDIEDVFGRPKTTVKETRNNLSPEEANTPDYWQAIIYSKSKDDCIYVLEADSWNALTTVLWVCFCIGCQLPVADYRMFRSKFNYKRELENIKNTHRSVDVEELSRKIKIKQANYDRLVR